MRILGVDPGSSVTGYGVIERMDGRLTHVAHGTLRLPAAESLPERLDLLYRTIVRCYALYYQGSLVGAEQADDLLQQRRLS